MKKRALYIGRFQPIHFGHLNAIQQILEHPDGYEEILICIGSAEKAFLPKDPLTAGERFELILMALEEAKIPKEKISIFPVKNIDRYSLWPFYVQQLCPKFEAVFSGSPLVRMLFETAFPNGNPKVYPLEKQLPVSASEVRNRIKEGASVSDLIPHSVSNHLKEIDLEKRLKNMTTH